MAASKFTPENRGALLERAAAGVSLADSCRALDLRLATAKGWISRGRREQSGEYSEFVAALERSRCEVQERPSPMTEQEFQRRLDSAVRSGSVQAMKLWDERSRRDSGEGDVVHEGKIASLADRRRRKAAV